MTMISAKMLARLGLVTLAALPLQAKADPGYNWAVGAVGAGWQDPADAALDASLAAAESCAPGLLDLTAESQTRIGVLLLAPCHVGESVVIDHAGIEVQTTVAANGALYVALPVLQADDPVTVTYRDGPMLDAYLPGHGLTDIQDTAARW